MTVVPPALAPVDLSGFPSPVRAYTGVADYVYESAMTYPELVESIRRWIPQVLIPSLSTNFDALDDAWAQQVTNLETAVDAALALEQSNVNAALATQSTSVNDALATALANIANKQISVTDAAVYAMVQNAQTQTRVYLDNLYGSGAMTDANIKVQISGTNSVTRDYLDTRYDARYDIRYGTATTRGWQFAPIATGVAATDTANIQAALLDAANNGRDLYIPKGRYELNAPLNINLNRHSVKGAGDVVLDFYNAGRNAVFNGPCITIRGNGASASGSGAATNPLNHVGTKYTFEHFKINGPDFDAGALDGIKFDDIGIGVDFVTIRHLMIYGMRDGITYGDNTWSSSIERCTVHNPHRYGINLFSGTNTGEAHQLINSSIFGAHNANGNAAAVYAPDNTNVEFRMIGGSLDYNDVEGIIYGGALTFNMVHIEDDKTGSMFVYKQGTSLINVSFRDCAWDSAATGFRPYIHEILNGSGQNITITFDGDKGGTYPNTNSIWLQDDTNNRAAVTGGFGIYCRIKGWALSGQPIMLGQHFSMLTNGDFEHSTAFVASPGINGWTIPGVGSWSIGAGGNPGAGLKLVASAVTTGNTLQRVPVTPGNAYRVAGKMLVTARTAGAVSIGVQFLDANGTAVPAPGSARIGASVSAVDAANWQFRAQRFTVPPGASYMNVNLSSEAFTGTAYWDGIEVVSV